MMALSLIYASPMYYSSLIWVTLDSTLAYFDHCECISLLELMLSPFFDSVAVALQRHQLPRRPLSGKMLWTTTWIKHETMFLIVFGQTPSRPHDQLVELACPLWLSNCLLLVPSWDDEMPTLFAYGHGKNLSSCLLWCTYYIAKTTFYHPQCYFIHIIRITSFQQKDSS